MSKISKAGNSRIPTFSSHLPQPTISPRQTQHSAASVSASPPPSPPVNVGQITNLHIGRRVRSGEKEGVLRFVGPVHFSKGTWCGVELNSSIGKNDGVVNGVRYFACAAGRGLMAPLAKLALIEDSGSYEHLNDDVSGPYSMLFINPKTGADDKYVVSKEALLEKSNINETYITNDPCKIAQRNNDTPSKKTSEENTITQLIPSVCNNTYDVSIKKRINETFILDDDSYATITTGDNDFSHQRIEKNSFEHTFNDSSIEVKRRRTSNPKNQKIESILLRNITDTIDKPSSLPQLKSVLSNSTPPFPSLALKRFSSSTPVHTDFTESHLSKSRYSGILFQVDDNGIWDSLECEESLGILTPTQLLSTKSTTRSPSLDGLLDDTIFGQICSGAHSPEEDIPSNRANQKPSSINVTQSIQNKEDIQSPDYSLGIINSQIISTLTMNLDRSVDRSKDFPLTRLEQTPSPEELPLDTTPIVESDPKTEPCKTKTTNSFITSITSITSLDTGYQGDGEMSRPASRGADNSPLTRRPLPRPQARRQDPMTDSDFYTESEADNHEDNPLRICRRAQVIDGTLYGVDPQAAADIYVNNRENMDSSGIFTDIENSIRKEEEIGNLDIPDVSPSDISSKTISENSQNNLQQVLDKNNEIKDNDKQIIKDNPKKRNAPSPGISSPSYSSPRHGSKEDNAAKKYKMPRRDVPSKVESILEPTQISSGDKKSIKKPVGRWDAVMNKITKTPKNKTNLKDVKSKVFDNINVNIGSNQRHGESRKPSTRPTGNQKTPNNKLFACPTGKENVTSVSPKVSVLNMSRNLHKSLAIGSIETTAFKRPISALGMLVHEKRRIRNRPNSGSPSKINGSNVGSSIHSSLSDLSAATLPPNNKTMGTGKKRTDVVQVTQVLTANKLSPRTQQQAAVENKKVPSPFKARRAVFSPKENKQTPSKECGRGTVKGGRTSPTVRPPQRQQQPPSRTPVIKKHVPPVAEALAVLLQHLQFYVVPNLRRQVQKYRLEAEEIRLVCEEKLSQEKLLRVQSLEDERARFENEIAQLVKKHRNQIEELNSRHADLERCLISEKENAQKNLCKQHEEQLSTLKIEFQKLQRTHEESLVILREENEAIRDQIDEKQLEVDKAKHESKKLKEDYENKEVVLKEQNQKLQYKFNKIENSYEHLIIENKKLREENDRLLGYGDDKGIGLQEVQSLRVVLELKQNEVADLRRALAEATQKEELLAGAEEKARILSARCEDLQLQLERKSDYEKSVIHENQKLQENLKEEVNQKKRLSQHNEVLQWKLKQNKEVFTKVLQQADESAFNRSLLSSSFNERHMTRSNLERTLSFRERTYSNRLSTSADDSVRSGKSKNFDFEIEDFSPPNSPKVKGVVEKSDSVSYVLDLDENPEVVASRIVRRSFRNTTPPKNTPTKSPSNKRARIRNPLSQSASSSAIITPVKCETDNRNRTSSVNNGDSEIDMIIWSDNTSSNSCVSSQFSMKLEDHLDLDEDNEVDIQLPALPSELDRRNGAQALPTPKHMAGEPMNSDSNSEDESTSSSQL